MRNAAVAGLKELYASRPFVFLTGDVGYGALEPLRQVMGERFINAGIAEQNMISVSAGLAIQGHDTWVYSIAPFCYARPFEQIRNDICLHDLPVKIVGNGGGYAYGPMGATHHALEDYGILLTLPAMRVYIPLFNSDVAALIPRLARSTHPCYLRLGRCEKPPGYVPPPYTGLRLLLEGAGAVLIAVGPLAGGLVGAFLHSSEAARPEIWGLSELPLEEGESLAALLRSIACTRRLCVVEEHVAQGGAGQILRARALLSRRCARTVPAPARGWLSFGALWLATLPPQGERAGPGARGRSLLLAEGRHMMPELRKKVENLAGPVLVLGASGFIGANLFRMIREVRPDVHGVASRLPAWRLEPVMDERVVVADLLVDVNLQTLLDHVRPATVFNCIAYGAYSFEQDHELIYRTNVSLNVRVIEELARRGVTSYVHAGSSSDTGRTHRCPKSEPSWRPTATTPSPRSLWRSFCTTWENTAVSLA